MTVLIPVRDRPELLDRCLTALGRRYPVLSWTTARPPGRDGGRRAARHGASLLRRAANGGPAAARNTGLAGVTSELVAFLR